MFYALLLVAAFIIVSTLADSDIDEIFKDTKVIPDVIDEAPKEKLKIEFENGVIVGDGLEFKPAQTWSIPTIDWPSADPNKYYAVYMGCPDAPDEKDPRWREALHWLVLNVPGNQVDKGELYCPYLGPLASKNGGMMRYVYLVYEQPNKMTYDEKVVGATDWEGHVNYKVRKFMEKYKFGQPVAGNIYRAQWDETVPLMHKRMGITVDE